MVLTVLHHRTHHVYTHAPACLWNGATCVCVCDRYTEGCIRLSVLILWSVSRGGVELWLEWWDTVSSSSQLSRGERNTFSVQVSFIWIFDERKSNGNCFLLIIIIFRWNFNSCSLLLLDEYDSIEKRRRNSLIIDHFESECQVRSDMEKRYVRYNCFACARATYLGAQILYLLLQSCFKE